MSSIKHVAIIMDGNGRWAQGRSHSRVFGHIRGSSKVSNIVEKASDMGLEALSLYAFSTENWTRPQSEVSSLFKILKKFLLKERARIIRNNISFKVIGEIDNLPIETIKLIKDLEEETKNFSGLKLSFAFGYGSRFELVRAANLFISKNPGKQISEQDFSENLYRPDAGEVDLMIRTGGDLRISNFLLWQNAYAELYFTPTAWPDFSTDELETIINNVSQRERRFGGLLPNKKVVDVTQVL